MIRKRGNITMWKIREAIQQCIAEQLNKCGANEIIISLKNNSSHVRKPEKVLSIARNRRFLTNRTKEEYKK